MKRAGPSRPTRDTTEQTSANHTLFPQKQPFIVETRKSSGAWITFSRHADVVDAQNSVRLLRWAGGSARVIRGRR